jgi:O-methyltransferase
MRKLLKKLAYCLGYDISIRACPRLAPQAVFDRAKEIVAGSTMLSEARQSSLFDQVLHCEQMRIEGAIVECGVWKGGAIGLTALALLHSSVTPNRELHLFDAFSDICPPDPAIDGSRAMDEFKKFPLTGSTKLQPVEGAYDSVGGHGTVLACRELIEERIGYPSSLVQYHVGWFQDVLPTDAPKIGPIAILRLDGDWYASTKVCLDYLYDRVVSGGFVIIDDYGAYEGCKRAVDEFMRERVINAFLHRVDQVCYYFVKP